MKYESSFKSEADGLEISVMALIPDKKPYRAVVQLVHGMSEHKERYIPGSLTVGYQKKVPAGRIKPAFFVSNFWFLSIVFYCNVL